MINHESCAKIVKQLQSGEKVPRSSIMLAVGFLSHFRDLHKKNNDTAKLFAVNKVIIFLQSKA